VVRDAKTLGKRLDAFEHAAHPACPVTFLQSRLSTDTKNPFDLWSGLDVRHLAAFEAVAATGSIARAARQLGYTQPAVSHQIATLERLAGSRLFDRGSGRGRATLTEAGRLFAIHVDAVNSRLAGARADLDALRDQAHPLRVGAFQSVSARILPALLQRLAREESQVPLDLTEATEEADLLAGLARGDLDFAFALLPTEGDLFATVELLDDPWYLVAPPTGAYPVAISSLRELADVPLIAPRTCRSWMAVADQLQAAGVEPRYAFRTDDNHAIKALVQNGTGVAFLSKLVLDMLGDGLATAPLADLVAPRRIGLAWSADRAQVTGQELFTAVVQEVCDAIANGSRRGPRAIASSPPSRALDNALN
jgi:molybdate transport repressor ModE-like protein